MNNLSNQSRFDLDSLLDHFLGPLSSSETGFFSPRVDITEKGEHFIIAAELPGVEKEDCRVIRQERRYGYFQRGFTVGDAVQENDISALFKMAFSRTRRQNHNSLNPRKGVSISDNTAI